MAQSIRISDSLYNEASTIASLMNRSLAQQIEHWAQIGRSMEETKEIEYAVVNRKLISQFKKDAMKVSQGIISPSSLSIFNPEEVRSCVAKFPEIDFELLTNDYS